MFTLFKSSNPIILKIKVQTLTPPIIHGLNLDLLDLLDLIDGPINQAIP